LNNAGTVALSGGIGGGTAAIAVTQTGAGTTTIASTNSYTGATTVSAGTVIVSGALNGTTSASVAGSASLEVDGSLNNGATTSVSGELSGTGSVGGITSTGGTIAPGLSAGSSATGTLTANGNVSLDGATTFSIRVGVGTETATDALSLSSGHTINLADANLTVSIGSAVGSLAAPDSTDLYVIINGGASGTGTGSDIFGNVNTSGLVPTYTTPGGFKFNVYYASDASGDGPGTGNDVVLKLAAVPEPGTYAGLGMGIVAVMGAMARRRRG
jgi:autotransporter-associated beta strand protein